MTALGPASKVYAACMYSANHVTCIYIIGHLHYYSYHWTCIVTTHTHTQTRTHAHADTRTHACAYARTHAHHALRKHLHDYLYCAVLFIVVCH